MVPFFAKDDAADVRLRHAVALGKIMLSDAPAQGSDFVNLRGSQFCSTVALSLEADAETFPISMKQIFRPRHPFQIIDLIVRLIAVNMVDLMLRRWGRPKERVGNQPVDKPLTANAVDAQNSTKISTPYWVKRQHSRFDVTLRENADPADCPHPAKIGNLMRGLKADSRAPNFVHALACNHYPASAQAIRFGEHP